MLKAFLLWLVMVSVVSIIIFTIIDYPIAPIFAQPPSAQKPGQFNYVLQTRPQTIPSSLTDVIKSDVYLCFADIESNGQTIILQDKQGTPISLINNVLGSAGSQITWWFNPGGVDWMCRWFPGGLSWQASGTGTSSGYLTLKCTSPCVLASGSRGSAVKIPLSVIILYNLFLLGILLFVIFGPYEGS